MSTQTKILILVEHDGQSIKPHLDHIFSAAKQLGDEIHILIAGENCEKIIEKAKKISCIQQILAADHAVYAHQLAENMALLITQLIKENNYNYLLASSSTYSKNILPRVAGILSVNMISDVTSILSSDTFTRPMYAGNVTATVCSKDPIKILTLRPTAFPAIELIKNTENIPSVPIKKLDIIIPNELSKFENQQLTQSKRPELTAAKIIVSGGRGLKSAENFILLERIADLLSAAIGASRAAVDAGFAPNDYQVGQTGKIVAPDLYIAVGISGAIQHLAGMKDSKIVVAINSDPDAPIFAACDYKLVGDLFKILPELQAELENNIKI
jgi:electron transfer flavoprotein alpha subunit